MLPSIELLRIDADLSDALQDGEEEFLRRYEATAGACAELARGVAHQTLAMLARDPRPAPFGGYFAVDVETKALVGTCGFACGPTARGEPEIAYFTFPPFEGRGFASAMAAALIAIALRERGVKRVIAHTLPQSGASTRILERCGFRCMGVIDHVEDGKVWRWELPHSSCEP